MATLKKSSISKLHFDDRNINKGSEYGTSLLNRSISETGMGRSLLADKNGVLIAGNKTLEAAAALGIEEVTEVLTDGKEIIVVKRMDLDINSERGIKAKILDNTVSAHNYVEDALVAEAMVEEAEIVNLAAYGLKVPKDDEKEVSFTINSKAVIKIELTGHDLVDGAYKDICYLMNQKYPGSIVRVKGKE